MGVPAGSEDPVNFIPAESFFQPFQQPSQSIKVPKTIRSAKSSTSRDPSEPLRYAAQLELDDGTFVLVQFVMPTVWRIRYDPTITVENGYSDANTRAIVQDSFARLVEILQEQPAIGCWGTRFDEIDNFWVLVSIRYPDEASAKAGVAGTETTRLYFRKDPFMIQATRVLKPVWTSLDQPPTIQSTPGEKLIWETRKTPLRHVLGEPNIINNIVLNLTRPGSSSYLGFGEQGGRSLLKDPSFMNYYCYDNANYNQVYAQGPLDPREPLYHSCPMFFEVNGNPGFASMTANFVDNYSQVCLDFGKTNAAKISVGVRFGGLDMYVMNADNVREIIWLHTFLIGRPRLKPRYILGHHQGCYGYTTRGAIEDVVNRYRNANIPLDGMHIDVDFQHKYRTFTVDRFKFPNPEEMFARLKQNGVKCCTNITPILSFESPPDDPYPTILAAWDPNNYQSPEKNFLVRDRRYEPGTEAKDARYIYFEKDLSNGLPKAKVVDPNGQRPDYGDQYNFPANYNSEYPYHGGVSYGSKLGIAGFYPDLNRDVVRKFWGGQYKDLFDKGLEFVWQDMTTPAVAVEYGDMKGFPSRLLVSTDPYDQKPDQFPPRKAAIELWALYSYNLHKATYNGLNKLESRKNKRNFIIGRGSFAGMYRYAGLWTGDNASTWDFWRICIAQVLALGYIGISIGGVDMGGFMPKDGEKFCDPDLLIRWYSGAFMLPWYRNHYNASGGQKWFQEPYQYTNYLRDHPEIRAEQGWLYESVEVICRYYVQLRYSLMQLLYDTMFENQRTGLPMARTMLITDPDDTALFHEAEHFLDNQYLVGNDLMVCPIMDSHVVNNGSRDVYLPQPDNWYSFNLRLDTRGVRLAPPVEAGSVITYNAYISSDPAHLPYVTPIYVREGAIIPQIQVRQYIGGPDNAPNPITIHVYPGKNSSYSMYLDDGVSRSSAPKDLPQYKYWEDEDAASEYRQVDISQKTSVENEWGKDRTITLENLINGYAADQIAKDIEKLYTIFIWQDPSDAVSPAWVTFNGQNTVEHCDWSYDADRGAVVVRVPVELPNNVMTIVVHTSV